MPKSDETPKSAPAKAAPPVPASVKSPTYVNTPPEREKVVVVNKRVGVFQVRHLEHGEPGIDGKPQYKVHELTLRPGCNLIDMGLIETLRANNPVYKSREDVGMIEVFGEPKAFVAAVKQPRMVDLAEKSACTKTLRAILEHETRTEAVEALEDQIADIEAKEKDSAADARAKRKANRGRRGWS